MAKNHESEENSSIGKENAVGENERALARVRMREHRREWAFLHVGQMRGCGLRGDAISRLAVTNRVMATFATHSQFTFQINKELKNLTPLNFFGQMRSSRN